ncbi:MAG: DUF6600 domain-containing protein [Candidatus Acidiferrales bacterium]
MRQNRRSAILSFLFLTFFIAGFAPRAVADDDDPPSRVARMAYVQGSVSFQPAGTDDWVSAVLNRPITTGDQIWSDRDGRVELQLDGSLIRLSNNTGFSFLNLNDNVTQIQLTSGTILVRVRRLDRDETYEIDTPNLAFSIQAPGLYRIGVNDSGDSTAIKIRSGEGQVTGEGAAYTLGGDDSYTFSGTDQLYADSEGYGNGEDQFDIWAAARDRRWERSESARYVSADVVGYEDLDDRGEWQPAGEYGNVWFPRTSAPDWAPYRYGHWAYIEPWGYTWVDDEPWGFAPFHYGRWVSYGGRWGWVPAPPRVEGVVYVRPVYAPALVAWVGGPHFAVGVGVGAGASGVNVGWFPLGPREVYVPSYRVSRGYVDRVNVSNTRVTTVVVNNYYNTTVVNNNVNVTNVKYVNQGVRGAVTATTPRAFTSAQPVARNVVRFDQREVESAPVRAFTPAAVPVKQAVLGTGTAAARPPATFERRAVVARVAPPPPPPSFEKRQEAIKNNGGKPLSTAQTRQIEPAATQRQAPVKIAPVAKPVAPAAQANRPGQPQNRPAVQGAVPSTGNKPSEPPNRATNPNNPSQPAEVNRPAERPAPPPPASRPAPSETLRPNPAPKPPQPAAPSPQDAQADKKQQREDEQNRARQAQKQEQEQQRMQQQQQRQEQQQEQQRIQRQQDEDRQKAQRQQQEDQQKTQRDQEQQRQREQQQQRAKPTPPPAENANPKPEQNRQQQTQDNKQSREKEKSDDKKKQKDPKDPKNQEPKS